MITKPFGSAIRLTTVLTDAPLETGHPFDESRCGACSACVEICPAHAPSGTNWRLGLDRDEFFDAWACCRKATEFCEREEIDSTICGICIEACPWTRKYLGRASSHRAEEATRRGKDFHIVLFLSFPRQRQQAGLQAFFLVFQAELGADVVPVEIHGGRRQVQQIGESRYSAWTAQLGMLLFTCFIMPPMKKIATRSSRRGCDWSLRIVFSMWCSRRFILIPALQAPRLFERGAPEFLS